MRIWMAIVLSAACGPIGPASGPPPPAAPDPAAAGPPAVPPTLAADDPSVEDAPAPDPVLASPGVRGQGRPQAPRGAARPPTSEAQQLVDAHNRVRAKHCARPLTWSPRLAQVAQQWANTLRDKGCTFGHSGGELGENLAAGTSGTLDADAVVRMWYDEVAHYRFPNGGFSAKTGHFTQVVWRGTAHVGCGRSQCKGMDIWVCEYDPAGNWEGQYRENVLPAGCR
jgi:pathogenesis-related protein 1